MFAVRFLVLLFLAFYSWSMGQSPPHELNAFGQIIAYLFFIVAPALYLLPTYEAWKNGHANLTAIALINIFLGWSLLGWVIAVVWAFKKPEPTSIATQHAEAVSRPYQEQRAMKKCPFCAEQVLAEAIKCKHCGSDLRVTS